MTPSTIVLATRNKGKIAELAALLEGLSVAVKGLSDYPEIPEIPEDGATFEENALIKARAVCKATGLPALADDSGLAVDALSGAPGVYSARYSGEGATDERNNAKLLEALRGLPEDGRACRFVCCMALVAPDGRETTVRGEWEGRVAEAPRGEGGFGYDPLFVDLASGRHAAELTREEKNARSHRGKALRALLDVWPAFWGATA
ncbi:Nucleoside-triphosphatase rdgB [Desulfovibrio sp. X2]|uniref:XTP/dITP diphosphatase n=1 Tax=Desulfovibrio sp. X2 TaxID=941449 RepID=UPI000358EE13|nr:XTP/dITP diphosphatase [Desulfovibrio sp. X2]EPR44548.1 Nucleoside-triphosphatase rdgB [Desulfovibrio sp. X2]